MQSSCTLQSTAKGEGSPADYLALAYYHLVELGDPEKEVKEHKEFLKTLDAKARIYISKQGINGQMSMRAEHAKIYMEWLSCRTPFQGVEFKLQPISEHIFPRLTVKIRKELVAYGVDISLENRGEYLTPAQWKEALEADDDKIIIDVRNGYEWQLGHFEGAELLPCENSKEFLVSVEDLKKRIDAKKTKVLMYCTGGIRCEIFSSLLKKEGIDNVFQLHGGVIRYGEEEKSKHWLGKLFVFDDRLSIGLSEESTPVIGKCHHCDCDCEVYYNCANMDCNSLFLCCLECLPKFQGCCQESCKTAERVRPYQFSHKPFRRWYNYAKTKAELNTLAKTKIGE